MDFEYDPQKSASNKIKHGIDFEEAKAIWLDEYSFEVPSAYDGEDRFLVIGKIATNRWTAIVTKRGEIIRIISVRRSRFQEVEDYDHRKGTR